MRPLTWILCLTIAFLPSCQSLGHDRHDRYDHHDRVLDDGTDLSTGEQALVIVVLVGLVTALVIGGLAYMVDNTSFFGE